MNYHSSQSVLTLNVIIRSIKKHDPKILKTENRSLQNFKTKIDNTNQQQNYLIEEKKDAQTSNTEKAYFATSQKA